MPPMTNPRRALDVLAAQDPEFTALAEILYGVKDTGVVYRDVFEKRAPDKDGDTQRRVAVASNLLGLTAGAAAIGSTLRDDRLNEEGAGKWAKRLHATGRKIPAPITRMTRKIGPKGAGRLAIGAAALQGANVAGDVVVARTLPKPEKKVSKAVLSVDDLAQGAYRAQERLFKPTGRKRLIDREKALKFGEALNKPLEHPKTTAGVVGAYGAGKYRGRRKGQQEGFQAGYYAKRDKEIIEKDVPDVEMAGTFSKFDDEKRQAFGFASVVKKNGMPVIDRQGDYIDADEMEKAAYHYVQKSRVGGDMHRRVADEYGIDRAHHVSDLIESMVFTPEKCKAMGLSDEVAKQLEGHWWVGYQIHDEDTWQEVRKNGRTGFSIHGRGKRQDTSVDKLMGY